MARKTAGCLEYREVTYSAEKWALFKLLREKAAKIVAALESRHLRAHAHGSIARGDVSRDSDVDVFLLRRPSSFVVDVALRSSRILPKRRFVVQATPNYAMKAYLEIDTNTSVSFPLMKMRRVEREFYKFGGEISHEQLKGGVRVPGVDKRLMLILPTESGHVESAIAGQVEHVAKTLGISAETVLDRIHALTRRDRKGRTGMFIEREISSSESFEKVLKELADQNPAVRRRMNLP